MIAPVVAGGAVDVDGAAAMILGSPNPAPLKPDLRKGVPNARHHLLAARQNHAARKAGAITEGSGLLPLVAKKLPAGRNSRDVKRGVAKNPGELMDARIGVAVAKGGATKFAVPNHARRSPAALVSRGAKNCISASSMSIWIWIGNWMNPVLPTWNRLNHCLNH